MIKEYKIIDIHGSCVSRDIFNFLEDEPLKFNIYCARHSIFAALQPSLGKNCIQYIDINSNFQRRMVEMDCMKTFFPKLQESSAKYLVIDLIDTARFPLLKYRESIVTGSSEIMGCSLYKQYEFEKINPNGMKKDEWKKQLESYVDKLKIYREEKNIIIHCTYFKHYYKDEKGKIKRFSYEQIMRNKLLNNQLKQYYKYLRELMPHACYIDLCKRWRYQADAKHHFGLSPVHYTRSYYRKVIEIINDL